METISHKLEHYTAYIQTWRKTIDSQLCDWKDSTMQFRSIFYTDQILQIKGRFTHDWWYARRKKVGLL